MNHGASVSAGAPLRCGALALVLSAALATSCSKKADPPGPLPAPPGLTLVERIDASLGDAATFMMKFQGEDGSFRSDHYAFFKDGWSLSPLVLATLLFLPQSPAVEASYQRGADFVATMVDKDGKLRSGEGAPSYFVYSTALAILVLNVTDNQRHLDSRDALIEVLQGMQMTEALGWKPEDQSYGGWGYFPGIPKRPAGEIRDSRLPANLTATLYAIGALRLANVPSDDPSMVKALAFIKSCQNYAADPAAGEAEFDDGGFIFTHELADGNKAGAAGVDGKGRQRYNSYGSITADGLRALIRLDLPLDHPRVLAAASWLERNYEARRTPGKFRARDEYRRESTYYYYAWSVAHALRLLTKPQLSTRTGEVRWAEALAAELMARQRDDGSWVNAFTEGREDDPVVATALAAAGLANARAVLTGEEKSHKAEPEEPIPLPM